MHALLGRDISRGRFRTCAARTFASCLAVVTLTVPRPARADDPPTLVDPIVVTAARVPQRASDALQAVTTISAGDIERAGQQTLVELLQARGGVEIGSTGGPGQPTSVFVRGANSSHTLVLVDGLRVNSATAGTTAFENIPLAQIDHIEIVAGPLSSLYGSDAVGGVIQIFTKRGSSTSGGSVYAGVGTYNTQLVNAALNANKDGTDLFLSAGYTNSGSFDATKPTIPFDQHNPDKDSYHNANFSGRLAHRFDADNELGIEGLYSDGHTDFDSSATSDDVNHQTLSTYSLYSRNQINAVWNSLVRVGVGEDDSHISGAFPGKFRTNQNQATWQNTFNLWGGSLIAGLEYLDQRVASDTAYTVSSRNIASAFAGYQGNFGNQGIQLNVRQDDNNQFGDHTTGSAGYGYRIGDRWRLRASIGNAFHAPTFNDLYYPGFGNPNLQAERSRSGEAGVDYDYAGQRITATYFENRISNLIAFDSATFLPENVAEARIRGAELAYVGSLWDTRISARGTFQNPIDLATGQQLPRRAKQFGGVAISRNWDAWQFGAEVIASGARFDATGGDPASRMGGYTFLNLYVTRSVASQWSVELRWNNVTNKDYELAQFYNTPGSNVLVSVRWTSPK
jgi:vitamin B12 transporter